ncbi:MAG: hypothetical protein L0H93_04755 [Nocardioides sp.]|nr:hypothetical protein [Nocardioides sp.]
MVRIIGKVMHTVRARLSQPRNERGEGAVPWLVVLGFGVAIAIFAGDSVMAFAQSLVGQLGGK